MLVENLRKSYKSENSKIKELYKYAYSKRKGLMSISILELKNPMSMGR